MKPFIAPTVALAGSLMLSACASAPPTGIPASPSPTNNTRPLITAESPTPTPAPSFNGRPLPMARGEWFIGSGVCAQCHTKLTDASGQDVAMDSLWRTSMMANSAIDPYWQASVRREVILTPGLRATIEDTCSRCHMPMARTSAVAAGNLGVVLDDGFLNPANPLYDLAMDGVSCSVCHQIQADQLGQPASFSGQFVVDTTSPMGQRTAFGPFIPDPDGAELMQMASGLLPIQGQQLQQPELCATCHTLYTPFVDAQGNPAGEFPEQMPYLEWEASAYAGQQTCQSCHMPEANGGVALSINGGPTRQPVRMHSFLGGSSTVLGQLRADGYDLGVAASSDQLDDEITRMTQQMQTSAATVTIQNASLAQGKLSAQVVIQNLTGHKFPTAFPSRRVWLHISVTDSAGQKVFESGAYGADGSIEDNANDQDPASFEPHYLTLTSPDQVQIYEDIMGDTDGKVTTTLIRAARYLKDNRLLPQGFDKATVGLDIAVVGQAAQDPDFTGGGDTLRLSIDAGEGSGPYTLVVELLYQSVGYRWAENVMGVEAPENQRFAGLYSLAGNPPLTVATAEAEVR